MEITKHIAKDKEPTYSINGFEYADIYLITGCLKRQRTDAMKTGEHEKVERCVKILSTLILV